MRVVAFTLTLLLVTGLAVPPVAANEMVTAPYLAPNFGGPAVFQYGGVGGVVLSAQAHHPNVEVTADDLVFGATVAMVGCTGVVDGWTGAPHAVCHQWGCSGIGLITLQDPEQTITVFVFGWFIADDLDVCGASSGEISANFY